MYGRSNRREVERGQASWWRESIRRARRCHRGDSAGLPWFCGRGAKIPTKTHDVRRRRSDGRRKTVQPKSTTILLLCFLFLAPVFYFWFFPQAQLEERYECMRASVGSFFPGLHVQLAPIIRVQRFELNYNISYHSYNKSLFGYQIPHMLL